MVRLIDARCETRDWEGLFRIRERAQLATQTGRQVWPAATLAEYRLALHASTEWAAKVLQEDAGRFTIGPLTEVVAQNHSWHDLQTLHRTGSGAEGNDFALNLHVSLFLITIRTQLHGWLNG